MDTSFDDTNHWLTFLNLTKFLEYLTDPQQRVNIHPAFILAILAMATLMRSSEVGYGGKGRDRALLLKQSAKELLDDGEDSKEMDPRLAQAALVCDHTSILQL